MCDCGNGVLGRYEGMKFYCSCLDGLDAHLGDLAAQLGTLAETLQYLDALDKVGQLDKWGRAAQQRASELYKRLVAEHDRIERAWTRERAVAVFA